MHKLWLLPFFGFLSLLTGCKGEPKGKPAAQKSLVVSHTFKGTYPIKVICTTGMVADLARNIGGDRVRVEQLMGADVDPHLYRPNTTDMEKLNHANVILFNGLHLEGKMGETLERLGKKVPSFGIGDYLDPARLLAEDEGTVDPHIWFDVSLWSEAAAVVRDVLTKFDQNNAEEYRARAEVYQKQLAVLHSEVEEQIGSILPREKRLLITSHDAFRYFGKAYAIEVRGVQGISTEGEAGLKDIEEVVNLIVERQVKAVFIETSVNRRNIDSIIEGCAARGHKVRLGGELFSDAMGAEGTPAGTYLGMIRQNVAAVVGALK